jgi:O-antigen/teichoic acid export membrane protein
LSVTGSDDVGGARVALSALPARVRAWLADHSDNSRAQRMAGSAFLIRVASAGLLYLSQVLLARWMGTFEFGVYVYVWTWVLLIGGFGDIGLALAAQRFIPEYSERKAFAHLRGFLAGSRWIALAVATALAGVAALGVTLARPWLNHYELIPLYLACMSLPFYALTGVQDGIARSYNWPHLGLLPPYIVRPILMIALMAVAFAAGLPVDAATAMLAAVGATWLTALGQLFALNRRLAREIKPGPKAYAPRTWLATSFPILMVEGFYLLLTYTDVLMLQQFRPPEDVAVYYAAAKTLALVAFVYFSVAAATAHKFTAYHVAGDRERLEAFVMDAVRWTFWPSLAATLVILALGRPFLWLFGPQFLDGYPVMFVLAVGLLARASVGPVERLLNMLGEQRACALVYAGAFAFNVVACIVLIPRFGVMGAAVATATALAAESVLLFWVTKRRLGIHAFVWRPARSTLNEAPRVP